ncbi:MAG TPA: DNA methyltransferase [Pirellulales bacterium]|nr:DNA methyltransferase [Pirellulales bacterium]
MRKPERRLIETDEFPFEFLSQLAERESWRKEIHRPIYHVHKWWAKRLGSVFRGILLGTLLPERADLSHEFYRCHEFRGLTVFDPFMGSGTTMGEAHKLGLAAIGRDINPVAVDLVETALGPLDRRQLLAAFEEISASVGARIRELYRFQDAAGRQLEVLYHFWVMQADCPECRKSVDLFPSYIIARNAYPKRKPEVQVLCPQCGAIFPGTIGATDCKCDRCGCEFDAAIGRARGTKASCGYCKASFAILDAVSRCASRPEFRLFGKLVLTANGYKEYHSAGAEDRSAYEHCSDLLKGEIERGEIELPDLALEHGYNTRQAMRYGFKTWRDFFNDRQLLALGWLRDGIAKLEDPSSRKALLTLFSGVLEFNNLFASYKGEGTGAVRHMFSHHILKPERTPIEANVWGTPKSSGAFSNLFRSRLLRAIDYREAPLEVNGGTGPGRICAGPFTGRISSAWPVRGEFVPRTIYLSCGDSSNTDLPDESLDLVVTDPPFFDNVHYSELADFFFAWQQLTKKAGETALRSTRHPSEVQDAEPDRFARKLQAVFRECHRILKNDGLLAFTYHHSREEGWRALAEAILGAGFRVVNSQPVKAEMSVATPKSQAKEPIQLDIVVVCRKRSECLDAPAPDVDSAIESARAKLDRLGNSGFTLSRNDRKIVLYGQLLTSISHTSQLPLIAERVETELHGMQSQMPLRRREAPQRLLFEDS